MFAKFFDKLSVRIDNLRELLDEERQARAELFTELRVTQARADALQQAATLAQANFEWARLRMNQLEHERSQLFAHVLKVPLAPMTVERESPVDVAGMPFGFQDVGDEIAKRWGLEHEGN